MKTKKQICDFREQTKSAFMWRPGNSGQRRARSKHNSFDIQAEFEGNHFRVISNWNESCNNVYNRFEVYKNDIKQDVRALKLLPDDLQFFDSRFISSSAESAQLIANQMIQRTNTYWTVKKFAEQFFIVYMPLSN